MWQNVKIEKQPSEVASSFILSFTISFARCLNIQARFIVADSAALMCVACCVVL
jgi:hypothetical protein